MLFHKIQGAGGVGGAVSPEFVGGSSASGSTSLSFTSIADLQEGDLVICNFNDSSSSFSVTSSGWTPIVTNGVFPANGTNNSIQNTNCYKFMGATVDTGISLSATVDALTCVAFRNVETPISNGFEATTSSQFFQSISRTIATDNSVFVICAMIDDDSATISTTPSGFTIGAQNGRAGGSNALMYKLGVSAGTLSGIGGAWSSSDDLATRGFEIPPA